MYASLMISLLAAFVAMLGKQWLNRYLRNSGGSMIERCGDRQRKFNGLKKWPLNFFVESLPVMLQAALLLLACGLCRHMWSINAPVACTLISLTGLGVVFYIGIVIAGMSSYACPFQTPASTTLHGPWKKARRGVVSLIVHSKRVFSRTHRVWKRGVRSLLHHQSQPAIPLEVVQVDRPEPWLNPEDLAIICRKNADDVQCVSWILENITDPEALDAALPVAGEIRWTDCGVDVGPIYSQIVSTFESCFDSARTLYPGSRDRAYYSARAMFWINTLVSCNYKYMFAYGLPSEKYTIKAPDPDLEHLLESITKGWWYTGKNIKCLLRIDPGHTPLHSEWISNLFLHSSRFFGTGMDLDKISRVGLDDVSGAHEINTTTPLSVKLNRLLTWCSFLGSPVEPEVLKIQNRSYGISYFCSSGCSLLFTSGHMKPALYQLSKAVLSAVDGTPAQQTFIPHVLRDLVKLEYRPKYLTDLAYSWCSVIYEKREHLRDWESLLLVCLEIGFRHLDFRTDDIEVRLTHTQHHRGLVDVVFKSRESELIADLLHAWTVIYTYREAAHGFLDLCPLYLVGLHNMVPFSPRLRRLVIRSVRRIGYKKFEEVGVERFIGLLNHLDVTVEDMDPDEKGGWSWILLYTIQSSEGTQHLSHSYWEFLVEFAASEDPVSSRTPWRLSWRLDLACSLQIITSLTKAKEWSKLECWMGIVWMLLPKGLDPGEGDLGHSMTLLFRQRPGAVQKLEQWMEQRSQRAGKDVPESFKQAHKRAHEAAQRDGP